MNTFEKLINMSNNVLMMHDVERSIVGAVDKFLRFHNLFENQFFCMLHMMTNVKRHVIKRMRQFKKKQQTRSWLNNLLLMLVQISSKTVRVGRCFIDSGLQVPIPKRKRLQRMRKYLNFFYLVLTWGISSFLFSISLIVWNTQEASRQNEEWSSRIAD